MNIAILGGSFDPPHNGHFLVISQVLKFRPDIEKIILVPVFKHQWKPVNASVADRLNMLSFLKSEKVEISDIEIKRKGISYTIDTIKEIKRSAAQAKIYWIVGSDILSEWHRWEKKDELTSLATFLIFPRDPYNIPKKIPKGFEIINNKDIITTDVSSTEIRQRTKSGLSIRSMVPERIEKYIIENKLYLDN
jgi:nicotinate-nucleotide adenylyltransferase